jgi:hypothetical protein
MLHIMGVQNMRNLCKKLLKEDKNRIMIDFILYYFLLLCYIIFINIHPIYQYSIPMIILLKFIIYYWYFWEHFINDKLF